MLFIAMRYVRGGDVRTVIRREGPLSPSRAAAIISAVASALDAAHASGLVTAMSNRRTCWWTDARVGPITCTYQISG